MLEFSVNNLVKAFGISKESAKSLYDTYRYNYKDIETFLEIMNKALHGFGVESIYARNKMYDEEYLLLYVNMGDPYETTVMYDSYDDRIYIGSWGDWVGWRESEFDWEFD